MGLYNSHVIHWPLEVGDHVAWIRYPFGEYILDPIFKVIQINNDDTFNIEVVLSDFLDLGHTYVNQPIRGFRKVKLTPIGSDLRYDPSF
jgi:hypothetical protein